MSPLPRHLLLTGATGFLGQTFAQAWLAGAPDRRICALVRPGRDLSGQPRRERLDWREEGASLPADLDGILHAAARLSGSSESLEAANVALTEGVLDLAIARHLPLLHISSRMVLGAPDVPVVRESTPPAPRTDYGRTKHRAEARVIQRMGEVGLPWRILRLSALYGLGCRPRFEGAIGAFLAALREGRPARIAGQGSQLLDYLHVRDACRALEAVWQAPPGLYHAGGGRECSVLGLAQALRDIAPAFRWVHDLDAAEQRGFRLDHGALTAATGWRPLEPLETGLREGLETL